MFLLIQHVSRIKSSCKVHFALMWLASSLAFYTHFNTKSVGSHGWICVLWGAFSVHNQSKGHEKHFELSRFFVRRVSFTRVPLQIDFKIISPWTDNIIDLSAIVSNGYEMGGIDLNGYMYDNQTFSASRSFQETWQNVHLLLDLGLHTILSSIHTIKRPDCLVLIWGALNLKINGDDSKVVADVLGLILFEKGTIG